MFSDDHGAKLNTWIRNTKLHLARCNDVRLVGDFACRLKDEVAPAYEEVLIRLLPQINVTDGHLLGFRARGYLHWALLGRNVELVIVILSALEKVGDRRAIRNIAKLANGKASAAREQRIRQKALCCLEVLTARVELEEQMANANRRESRLLRPASAATGSNPTLLRPLANTEHCPNTDRLVTP